MSDEHPLAEAAPRIGLLERRLPDAGSAKSPELLLERFLEYCTDAGLELYPAQEEAVLEIYAGRHVILNTPTGSGKSLVSLAACFRALAHGERAFYTAPIKALVTEKFFELSDVLGARNVGLMTGDATVNREAKIVCCTAEILSNLALRKGAALEAAWIVMDEFHYYSDRERGVAWQVPLLCLPRARFLLMSATLGDMEFFRSDLERRTGVSVAWVRSAVRPVPLDFEYKETPLQETLQNLVHERRVPVYVVYFSQRSACEAAQDLMSLNFLSKEEKRRLKEELIGFRFDSPFGKVLARHIAHGIGVHHAGMLPKYRRLVERLARKSLLSVIAGTDTLGVGVNVPIRSVLFTQLCKFDGENTVLLSVRDFHQIAGRAGRKGFDDRGSVLVQAPEHEIENKRLKERAAGDPKKLRKLHAKKPPERGYKPWNHTTLTKLLESRPEPLTSRFNVTHGMLLSVLQRGPGSCQVAKSLVRTSHESRASQRRLLKHGLALFRSLVEANILTGGPTGISVNAELQADFSLNQELALYAVEVFESLDQQRPDHALVVLSVLEATLENPTVVLRKQVDTLRTRRLAELKAAGVEYEERLAELEKVDYPKPEAEFIYSTFNMFREHHPWVLGSDIAPKSVVRDMYEQAASFNDYVKEYGLAQAEGVLLRYLTDAYRALRQTVPDKCRTPELFDVGEWLGAELRSIDASLIEEWEALERMGRGEPPKKPDIDASAPPDITANRHAFRILVRNAAWRFIQAVSIKDYRRAKEVLDDVGPKSQGTESADVSHEAVDSGSSTWTDQRLEQELAPYWAEYDRILLDTSARSAARSAFTEQGDRWRLRQTLSDPEGDLAWAADFEVDLDASRASARPVLTLTNISGAV